MKRETKAALALALLLLVGLAAFFLLQGQEPEPEGPAPSASLPGVSASRSLAGAPSRHRPSASPRSSQRTQASPGRVAASPSTQPTRAPLQRATPVPETGPPLEGRVLAPKGGPVRTHVFAFEVGAHIARSFADYGDKPPTEVKAIARALTKGRGNHLVTVATDEAGRFSIPRSKIKNQELVLVSAAEAGSGGLRLAAGALRADLRLDPWRSLRIMIVTRRPLPAAPVWLRIGSAGELNLKALDAEGACVARLPATRSQELVLEFYESGWASQTRRVSAAEQAAGFVEWTLPSDLVEVRGRVLDPQGAPWRGGGLELRLTEESTPLSSVGVDTDSEGRFVGRGFASGQKVFLEIVGGQDRAYYLATGRTGGPSFEIQLRLPSVLVVEVKGSEDDVGPFGTDWELDRKDASGAWQRLPGHFPARAKPPDDLPSAEDDEEGLERHFGLKPGKNTILGLLPGRYRISLGSFAEGRAEPVEVELPPGGSASCTLEVGTKSKTVFRGLLVSPGADLAKREAHFSFETKDGAYMYHFTLDGRGAFRVETDIEALTKVKIAVRDLKLSAPLTLDPGAPDLGTIVLEGR